MHRLHKLNLIREVDTDEKRDRLIDKGWKLLNPPAAEPAAEEKASKPSKK